MSLLADVERLLERVFERTSARVFRTRLQAVQLERRVERAMELARTVEAGRPVVPHVLRVRLSPGDLRSAASGDAAALAGRLAEAALAFARRNRFHLEARPTVTLVADASLGPGQVEIEATRTGRVARTSADRVVSPPVEPPAPDDPAPGPDAPGEVTGTDDRRPSIRDGGAGIRSAGATSPTTAFPRPVPAAPRAMLRVVRSDGTERPIELTGASVRLGRDRDNEIVLDDPRVSRHHGRLQVRRGALVYTDLGSTNGSRVNAVRVDEIALGHGDRLEVGDTVLVVEGLPD
jgi:pSer/pThr/pTyr-binding forkhead associated (FHA) protein